ncbi:MAG: hypothetical protein HZB25_04850 [Candidatus Eisenbacteria bacterium]|nr:hypothetical protein [Candidatus Eisenbacteria bacterium]
MGRSREIAAAAAVAIACALPAPRARADLQGYLQVQFQQLEQVTPQGNSLQRSFLQSYQASHSTGLGHGIGLSSQFQLNKTSFVDRVERVVSPQGSVRMDHPFFGLFASYRPGSSRGSDSLTTRQQETLLSGYLAPRGLPRLDVSWIRRHQDARELRAIDTSTAARETARLSEGATISRQLRAAQELGPVSLRAGYYDQKFDGADPRQARDQQRSWDAGGTYAATLFGKLGVQASYDYTDNRRGLSAPVSDFTRMHSANVSANVKISPKAEWNLGYSYRHTAQRVNATQGTLNDHDGSSILGYRPTAATLLSAGGGVRTARTPQKEDVLGYLVVSASAQGSVRPGWAGTALATASWNRFPGGQEFWVSTARAGSTFGLADGLELLADLQASSNGDTAARDTRVISQGSLSLRATPLRPIQVVVSGRLYHGGPGLLENTVRSSTGMLEVHWTPWPTFRVNWSYTQTGALPRGDPRVSTTMVNLDWKPGRTLEAAVFYTSSNQSRTTSNIQSLTGRENLGARLLAALSPSTRLIVGVSAVDPYRSTRSRAMEVTFTKSFGR